MVDDLVHFLKTLNDLIKSGIDYSYINISSDQRVKDLVKTKGKVGIYIFMDSKNTIVYIGKGGTSRKSSGKDLRFRIMQELSTGHNYSTLSKNIIENDTVSESESKSIIDNLQLNAIIIGDKSTNCRNDILKTEALESFLILIYDPKNNK